MELARKRGWKGYWVCLKGTTLLFYPCDSREGRSVEATPKHLIIVDGAIMQVGSSQGSQVGTLSDCGAMLLVSLTY